MRNSGNNFGNGRHIFGQLSVRAMSQEQRTQFWEQSPQSREQPPQQTQHTPPNCLKFCRSPAALTIRAQRNFDLSIKGNESTVSRKSLNFIGPPSRSVPSFPEQIDLPTSCMPPAGDNTSPTGSEVADQGIGVTVLGSGGTLLGSGGTSSPNSCKRSRA